MKNFLILFFFFYILCLQNESNAQWVPTGGPYGGDIRCLLSSGSLVFAGVNGGGVYLSSDNGLTWTARNSGLDDTEVYALAVKGSFFKTYFAGTSTGVSYSTNSGESWTTSIGLPESYISALLVNGNDLFAATWGYGVYRSTDNGVSWFASTTGITSLYTLSLSVIGSNLFVGTNGGGIFRSTDNGTSWTAANTGLTTTLISTFLVDGTNIYAGGSSGVFLSTDNGTTWTSQSTGFPASPDVYSLKLNGTTLYAASFKGLYYSTNYGTSWSIVSNVNFHQECYLSLTVNSGNLFAGSIGSGIFRTTDNGVTWTSNNVGILNFLTTAIEIKGNNLYASSSYDGVFLSTNGGDSWSEVNNGLTNKSVMTLVNLDNYLFAGTSGSGIFRSSNNGANWSESNNGITNTTYVPYDFVASGSNFYTAIYGGGIFVSTNNGENWAERNTGLTNLATTCMLVNGTDIYAGTWQGGIFRSTNGGANWTAVNNGFPTPSSKAISCLLASGSNIIAATVSGLYLTTNNGSSWTLVTYGVTNEWYGTLAKSGSSIFTSNHDGGVFLSTDNGVNWVSVNTGISPIMPVYKFKFDSTDIFAGIFGYSVWKRPLAEFGNGPGLVSDPSPADSAINVGVTDIALSWTNPIGTTANRVYFGTNPQSLSLLYIGTVVNTVNTPSPLSYNKTYYWRVDAVSSTGTTTGRTYTFSTIDNPFGIFFDNFETGLTNWTISNQGTGIGIWEIYTPPYPTAYGVYTLPSTSGGGVLVADSRDVGGPVLSTATITNGINALIYENVELQFDNDWRHYVSGDQAHVEVSIDSINWTSVWSKIGVSQRNTHETIDISSYVAESSFWIRFRSVQPTWDYWWAIDNITINAWNDVPVELTSFTASVSTNRVSLNWITSTETNNRGFEIERSQKSIGISQMWEKIGYAAGFGTTAESHSYSFNDEKVLPGNYSYRLKQIDFDGTFEYSKEIEAEVIAPQEFALQQNYPNPFNPSTTIEFAIPKAFYVILKVYNVLGQEVKTLISEFKDAGAHTIKFDAKELNSGMYIYKLEAGSFTQIRKMLLLK